MQQGGSSRLGTAQPRFLVNAARPQASHTVTTSSTGARQQRQVEPWTHVGVERTRSAQFRLVGRCGAIDSPRALRSPHRGWVHHASGHGRCNSPGGEDLAASIRAPCGTLRAGHYYALSLLSHSPFRTRANAQPALARSRSCPRTRPGRFSTGRFSSSPLTCPAYAYHQPSVLVLTLWPTSLRRGACSLLAVWARQRCSCALHAATLRAALSRRGRPRPSLPAGRGVPSRSVDGGVSVRTLGALITRSTSGFTPVHSCWSPTSSSCIRWWFVSRRSAWLRRELGSVWPARAAPFVDDRARGRLSPLPLWLSRNGVTEPLAERSRRLLARTSRVLSETKQRRVAFEQASARWTLGSWMCYEHAPPDRRGLLAWTFSGASVRLPQPVGAP